MNVVKTEIDGALIIEPKVFGDARGYFLETFNRRAFEEAVGHAVDFVQDNQSRSAKGVLRGLHLQLPPHAQGKLVRCSRGRVCDVAVDVRPASPTLGRVILVELSEDNHRQLWVPPGLAHGFLVLSDSADLQYKVTGFYAPQAERSIRWDDPELGIAWPDVGVAPLVSDKDRAGLPAAAVMDEIRALIGASDTAR